MLLTTIIQIAWLLGATDGGLAGAACFPERVALYTSPMLDAASDQDVGWIGSAMSVRVLPSELGEDGQWTAVAIDQPLPLRALVPHDSLAVFLTRDIAATPGWSFWPPGTPVTIEDVSADGGLVLSIADEEMCAREERLAQSSCDDLTSTLPDGVQMNWTERAAARVPLTRFQPSDAGVWWNDTVRLQSSDGRRMVYMGACEVAQLVERDGGWVLVDGYGLESRVRYRGWTPAQGMTQATGRCDSHTMSLCGAIRRIDLYPTAVLRRDIDFHPLAAVDDAGVRLPRGTTVELISADAGTATIQWSWPGIELKRRKISLVGHVPASVVKPNSGKRASQLLYEDD